MSHSPTMFRPQILIGILLGAILMVVAVSYLGIGDRRTSNPRRLVTHASQPIGSLFDAPASAAASSPPAASGARRP